MSIDQEVQAIADSIFALSRKIGDADLSELGQFNKVLDALESSQAAAIARQRSHGHTLEEIARSIGVTRQAIHASIRNGRPSWGRAAS